MNKKLLYLTSAFMLVTLLASACGGAAPTAAPEVPEELKRNRRQQPHPRPNREKLRRSPG